jgi:hypothetical protein
MRAPCGNAPPLDNFPGYNIMVLSSCEGRILLRKRMKSIYILVIALVLSGCTTLGTYIENAEYDYTNVPVTFKPTLLIFGEQFIIGDYSLVYKGNTDHGAVRTLLGDETTTGRKYVFYKNNVRLYDVEIVKQERAIQLSESATLYTGLKRYIRIVDRNRVRKEYAITSEQQLPYITFQDDAAEDDATGTVTFTNYQSRNKNDLDYDWNYNTGFNIQVNGEEYGILAFYPVSLYIRAGNNDVPEQLALYILTVYISHVYQ